MRTMEAIRRIDLDKPRYDQTTYIGRAKHFFTTTNPLNVLKKSAELDHAKSIVQRYKAGENIPGLTEDELWKEKSIYDSAFHPDTGEKMLLFGRMSFQVPGNMTITGCMMTFYKTTPAVIAWQWINQTFNAAVNYTNRSGATPISLERLGVSYALATTGAVGVALTINKQVKRFPPLVGRFVPFVAVAAANCINIPCMRSHELHYGIQIFDENGEPLGESPRAARKAITEVVFSRNAMAMPGMIFPPIIMNFLEQRGTLAKYRWLGAPLQVAMVGFMLVFTTPLCCALFPQQSSIAFSHLEADVQEKISKSRPSPPERVYFNKGL